MSTPYNGQSATQSTPGISGENTAGGVGVAGTSGNTPGVGVQATNTGSGYGVDASSALGVGLHATGQTQAALFEGSVKVYNKSSGGVPGATVAAPALTLDVYGLTGFPAGAGTSQTGVARLEADNNNVLDFGCIGVVPYSVWLQVSDRTNLGLNYPLVLQPNGGTVGIGVSAYTAGFEPKLTLDVCGVAGGPATSGQNQTGVARMEISSKVTEVSSNNVLDFGCLGTAPYGVWLQGTDRLNLALTYPLILQPNGGSVGIGTTTPNARLTVDGGGGETVDLSVSGRIMSGDANNNGGLWVNSAQSMFVGAESANTIGLYNGGWGLTMAPNGTVSVTGDVILTGADCAEDFDIAACAEFEAGTVMVLDDCGLLQESRCAYDKKVAGVISGAGKFKPGLILGHEEQAGGDGQRAPVALVGKVYCKVDAQHASIEVGDMLTTSATKGHAMKADDPLAAFGAVIGKALQSMPMGQRGLIPILVALQ
jgi:hypothetical protein